MTKLHNLNMRGVSALLLFVLMSGPKADAIDVATPLSNSEQVRYSRDTTIELQCVANPRPLAGIGRDTVAERGLEEIEEPEHKEKNLNAAILLETIRMVEAPASAH